MVAHNYFIIRFLFLFLFLLASSLNFRLRAEGSEIHVGGGEMAIAPYDFVIFASLFFVSIWRRVKFDYLYIAIFATFFFSLLSAVSAIHVEYVFYELFRGLKLFVLLLFLRALFSEQRLVDFLPLAASLVVIFEFSYCLYQYFFMVGSETLDATSVKDLFVENGVLRVSGTLRHPALLSFYMVLLLPLFVVGGISGSRFYYFVIVFFAFSCIGLTFSRTQYLLGFISVILCFFFLRRDSGGRLIGAKAPILLLSLGFLFLAALILANFQVLVDRFVNAPESSFTTRVLLAEIALNMVFDKPVVGVGLNNFVYAMPAYDMHGVHTYFPHPVHNMYLLVASEIGLLGFFSFAVFFAFFALRILRSLRFLQGFPANISRGILISFFALFVTGMQGWSFKADSIQLLLVMYVSLALAMRDKSFRVA